MTKDETDHKLLKLGWHFCGTRRDKNGFLRNDVSAYHLANMCHEASSKAGWWNDESKDIVEKGLKELHTATHLDPEFILAIQNILEQKELFSIGTKLCLIHSEVSEAMEGHRKGLKDDKLPHRDALEVELADAVIRIFDLAGALGYNVVDAILEKMVFNSERQDHKLSERAKAGGKKY